MEWYKGPWRFFGTVTRPVEDRVDVVSRDLQGTGHYGPHRTRPGLTPRV